MSTRNPTPAPWPLRAHFLDLILTTHTRYLQMQVPAPGDYTPLGTRTEQVRRVRGGLFLQKDGQTFVDQAARRARDIPGPLGLCLCVCVRACALACLAVTRILSCFFLPTPPFPVLFFPLLLHNSGYTLMQGEMPSRLTTLWLHLGLPVIIPPRDSITFLPLTFLSTGNFPPSLSLSVRSCVSLYTLHPKRH